MFSLLSSTCLVVSDSETPWTVACQAPLSMGFPRQEYWSGLPFLSSGDLPNPGMVLASPALASRFFTTEPPGEPSCLYTCILILLGGEKKDFSHHFDSPPKLCCSLFVTVFYTISFYCIRILKQPKLGYWNVLKKDSVIRDYLIFEEKFTVLFSHCIK